MNLPDAPIAQEGFFVTHPGFRGWISPLKRATGVRQTGC